MPRIAPDNFTPEQVRHAALRVWAAEVRDRQGPHASVSDDLAELAGILALILDRAEEARKTEAPANLVSELQATADLLIRLLLRAGVRAPEMPAPS